MAPPITTLLVFVMIIVSVVVEGRQLVPCLFFFGDSQFDNGNNNALFTLAKVNYQPYGIDYPSGATGRFANGRNVPDYLAQSLGFSNPIPPFATAGGPSIVKGLNYASGGAGILDQTGFLLGQRYTMNTQLSNHQITIGRIAAAQGRNLTSVQNDYLTKCVYVVNIGSNDYLNNYLNPFYPTRFLYTPERYAQLLIQTLSQQLTTLYNLGARKVAVFGIGFLGCIPQQVMAGTPGNATGCIDSVNSMVQLFNNLMKPLIDRLNQLSNARFTFINITSIGVGDPALSGIKVRSAPCCQVQQYSGLCVPGSVPCTNRNEYNFWDNYHVTTLLNRVTAARAYRASLSTDASPADILRLAQL